MYIDTSIEHDSTRRPKSRHWILFWGPPESSSTTFYWIILNFMAVPAFSLLSIGPVWYCATSTAEGGLWRSSTALVTVKKHCKRLSDQTICHMSYVILWVHMTIWVYSYHMTFKYHFWEIHQASNEMSHLCHMHISAQGKCAAFRRFAWVCPQQTCPQSCVAWQIRVFLMSRIGKGIDVELLLSQIVHSWDC